MNNVIEWTYLPWDEQSLAGTICWPCVVAGIIFVLITQIIRRTPLGYDIHQAPFLSLEVTGLALVINTAVFALFFWYAALGVSLFFSTVFFLSARGIQGRLYFEEKEGRWGLYPPLQKIRGEMFSEQTPEEQVAEKEEIDRKFRKLSPWWYFPLTILLPFAIILLLRLCGLPYIFVPHVI